MVATTVGGGPNRVYVIGGIHGDERTGIDTSRALLDHLRRSLPESVTVRWLIDANPDGSAAGTRVNANGVDLNRNWPTDHAPSALHGPGPLSEPESQALSADIARFEPSVIVAMHSAREGPFVNYDGPAVDLAHAFASAASEHERTWEALSVLDWTTPGSLGTHFGIGLGIPVVTVEGSKWDDPAGVLPELRSGLDGLLRGITTGPAARSPICDDHVLGHACTDLTRRVDAILLDEVVGGRSGFILKEAGGVVHAARWPDYRIYPASSIKVVHLFHLARLGGGNLESTAIAVHEGSCDGTGTATPGRIGDLVVRMMIHSDNEAANALQWWIGLDGLAATVDDLGLSHTRIEHGFGCGGPANDPSNQSTIADLVSIYDGVVMARTLDGDAREWFLGSLLDVTDPVLDTIGVPSAEGVRILAKSGWYDGNLSIAGIAETPGGDFVFGAFTDRPRSLATGFTIERVAAELLRDWIVPDGS